MSALAEQSAVLYWLDGHAVLQARHTRLAVAVQSDTMYSLAWHAVHVAHWMSTLAEQSAVLYWPAGQFCVHVAHCVFAVAVQAATWY